MHNIKFQIFFIQHRFLSFTFEFPGSNITEIGIVTFCFPSSVCDSSRKCPPQDSFLFNASGSSIHLIRWSQQHGQLYPTRYWIPSYHPEYGHHSRILFQFTHHTQRFGQTFRVASHAMQYSHMILPSFLCRSSTVCFPLMDASLSILSFTDFSASSKAGCEVGVEPVRISSAR